MRWREQLGINSTSDVWKRVLLIPNCTSNIVYY
jgi:hypothetical protein